MPGTLRGAGVTGPHPPRVIPGHLAHAYRRADDADGRAGGARGRRVAARDRGPGRAPLPRPGARRSARRRPRRAGGGGVPRSRARARVLAVGRPPPLARRLVPAVVPRRRASGCGRCTATSRRPAVIMLLVLRLPPHGPPDWLRGHSG